MGVAKGTSTVDGPVFHVARHWNYLVIPASQLGLSYGHVAGWLEREDEPYREVVACTVDNGCTKHKVCPKLSAFTGGPQQYEVPPSFESDIRDDIKRRRTEEEPEAIYGTCDVVDELGNDYVQVCWFNEVGDNQNWQHCAVLSGEFDISAAIKEMSADG